MEGKRKFYQRWKKSHAEERSNPPFIENIVITLHCPECSKTYFRFIRKLSSQQPTNFLRPRKDETTLFSVVIFSYLSLIVKGIYVIPSKNERYNLAVCLLLNVFRTFMTYFWRFLTSKLKNFMLFTIHVVLHEQAWRNSWTCFKSITISCLIT